MTTSEYTPDHELSRPSTASGAGRRSGAPLLSVSHLQVDFRRGLRWTPAVIDVSFELGAGTTLGLIGESGSGKSVTARAIMGLHPPKRTRIAGSIRFEGTELLGASERSWRARRGRDVAMVFQDPSRVLDPTMTIGHQVREALTTHLQLDRATARQRVIELLQLVRIPSASARVSDYPHQLSGGMRQRVMIAIALACNPKLLIADEATTAVDVTTQAQLMELLVSLQEELGMSILLISHDMGLAANFTDRTAVMYAGSIVEQAATDVLFASLKSPYTRALFDSVPSIERPPHAQLPAVPGGAPDLGSARTCCAFSPRCPRANERCRVERPMLEGDEGGHRWACFFPLGDAEEANRGSL